jgi:glycosyltransferase involved in cell wall biosynthesis
MSNNYTYKFTVFTPTFNREAFLINIYESLKRQTFKDFEWLIIDDGSTDDTESLVQGFIEEKLFPLRYIKQDNKGKHVAINTALEKAAGELFVIIDSDDYCKDNALERLLFHWENIPEDRKDKFSGVMSLCADSNDHLIGKKFPVDIIDSTWLDIFFKYNVKGDKWGFIKTKVWREYPFPIIKGEKFLSEGLIWNRIGIKYNIRFVNEKLLTANYQFGGLSALSVKLRAKNPNGAILYYKEFLSLPVNFVWKIRNLINYLRFSFHSKNGILKQIFDLEVTILKIIAIFLIPLAYVVYRTDLIKIR